MLSLERMSMLRKKKRCVFGTLNMFIPKICKTSLLENNSTYDF